MFFTEILNNEDEKSSRLVFPGSHLHLPITPDCRKRRWGSNMGHAGRTCSTLGKIHLEDDGLCLSGSAQPTVSDSERRIRAGEFSACRHRDLEEQALHHGAKMA